MDFTNEEFAVVLKSCELSLNMMHETLCDYVEDSDSVPEDVVDSAIYCSRLLYNIISKLKKICEV